MQTERHVSEHHFELLFFFLRKCFEALHRGIVEPAFQNAIDLLVAVFSEQQGPKSATTRFWNVKEKLRCFGIKCQLEKLNGLQS